MTFFPGLSLIIHLIVILVGFITHNILYKLHKLISYTIIVVLLVFMFGTSALVTKYSLEKETNWSYLSGFLRSQTTIATSNNSIGVAKVDAVTEANNCNNTNEDSNLTLIEYLDSQGRDSFFSSREILAKEYGIENYEGTASQNLLLMEKIKSDNQICKGEKINE